MNEQDNSIRTGPWQPAQSEPVSDRVPIEMPAQIGRYSVQGLLGEGGFGRVYLARDDKLNRCVAIKVPHRQLVTQPADAEVYLTEAQNVANLDHPNIVPVFDVGSTEDCPCFMVSKFMEGSTLAKRIKEDRPSFGEAAELVATVAEALHYAHCKGLVHRDIKPGNILMDTSGKPFVVDFGLALKFADRATFVHCCGIKSIRHSCNCSYDSDTVGRITCPGIDLDQRGRARNEGHRPPA